MSITVTESLKHSYRLLPNERFMPIPNDVVVALRNTPVVSRVHKVNSLDTNPDVFNFDLNVGSENYFNNNVCISVDLPLTFKRVSAPATTATPPVPIVINRDNFVKDFFNNFQNLALSQFPLLQAMENYSVTFDSTEVTNKSNILAQFASVSNYWDEGEVNRHFQGSLPDRFSSHALNTGSNTTQHETLGPDGKVWTTINPPLVSENPFGGSYSTRYNSRVPLMRYVSCVGDTCNVVVRFYTHLPLSFFGIPTSDDVMYGVNNLKVAVRLKPSAPHWLFSIRDGLSTFTNITFTPATTAVASLTTQVYNPPSHVKSIMKQAGLLNPYAIEYTNTLSTGPRQTVSVSSVIGSEQEFNVPLVQCQQIPKSIYISVMRKRGLGLAGTTAVPLHFGLIKSLDISFNGANTPFSTIESLEHLALKNGLDMDDKMRYSKGYAVKIDLGSDLSMPEDGLILGQTYNCNLAISGKFISPYQGDGGSDIQYEIHVMVCNEELLRYDGEGFSKLGAIKVGVGDIKPEHLAEMMRNQMIHRINAIGGGFLGDAWRGLKKGAVTAWNNRERIMDAAKTGLDTYRSLRGGSNLIGGGTKTLGAGDKQANIFK